MDISVIICTRNRSASLDRVLASAAEMSKPSSGWELLIVNNGEDYGVDRIVDRYAAKLPLRVEKQPEPGLSKARNCGMASARGTHIIWTDDDVILDRHWLVSYSEAIRAHPEAAVFGGRVVPILDPPFTKWFCEYLDLFWELTAAREFGPVELPLSISEDRVPFGANYAVRATEQRCFPYDINLGAGSGKVGEEVSVIRSILESGNTGYWVPGATVYHIIPPSRQTTEYVLNRYRAQGATKIYLAQKNSNKHTSLIGLIFRAVVTYLLYVLSRAFDLRPFWIKRLKGYAFWQGALQERLRNRWH